MGVQNNEDRYQVVLLPIDVASVAANTSAEQTFRLDGLRTTDMVMVAKPSLSAGLVISSARCSAPNTLAITFGNLTGSPIDPASENYQVFVFRPEKTFSDAAM